MHESSLVLLVIGVVELLLLASVSAVVFRRIQFPYTIGLVIVGVLLAISPDRLGLLEPIRLIRLTPDVVLYLFLPTLIFPAAVQLNLPLLGRNLYPILLLALPGLILSTVIIGGLVGALTPLSWGAAMLFGALISATDPVAVIALFKQLRVPGRLSLLVEGESLFNDATAIVLFGLVLSTIGSDASGPTIAVKGTVTFVVVSLGGLGVGAILAALYAALVRFAEDDPLVEIALSMVLAYAAFVVADHYLHVSGIMALVGAGLVGRRLRRKHFEKATEARAHLHHYWAYAEFVANSFVFLFLGIGGNTFLNRLRGASVSDLSYIAYAVVAVTRGPPGRCLRPHRSVQPMLEGRANRPALSDHHVLGGRVARRPAAGARPEHSGHLPAAAARSRPDGWCCALQSVGPGHVGRSPDSLGSTAVSGSSSSGGTSFRPRLLRVRAE